MMDISIYITLNEKSEIDKVIDVLKKQHIDKPVYIIELPDNYRISFDSDYEYFEIERGVISVFQDCEFVSDLGKGRKEIKMTIQRIQSPFSSDNWGRSFNSDPIETTIYLVRKSKSGTFQAEEPDSTFRVLFGESERKYTINVVPGINKMTDTKGFILVKSLGNEIEKPDLLVNKLFSNKTEAFWQGLNLLSPQIDKEFEEYSMSMKKQRKKKR